MVEQGTQRYQGECVVPENNHTFLKDGFVVFFCKLSFASLHFYTQVYILCLHLIILNTYILHEEESLIFI